MTVSNDNKQTNQRSSTSQPQGFRPMRRSRQQLSDDEAVEILRSNTAGVLSLMGDDGYPYGVPLSHVYHDGHLYFHTALRGHKVDAIRRCTKASFTVIDRDDVHPERFTTYFRSVVCFGRVRLIEDDGEKMRATRLLGDRCARGDEEGLAEEIRKSYRAMMMIDFEIEHMTGKEAIELVRMRKGEAGE